MKLTSAIANYLPHLLAAVLAVWVFGLKFTVRYFRDFRGYRNPWGVILWLLWPIAIPLDYMLRPRTRIALSQIPSLRLRIELRGAESAVDADFYNSPPQLGSWMQ